MLQSMGSQRVWHDRATEQQKSRKGFVSTDAESGPESHLSPKSADAAGPVLRLLVLTLNCG